MKNWKTTLTGILGAVATALIPVLQERRFELEYILIAAVIATLGVVSKDYDTTGAGAGAQKISDNCINKNFPEHPEDQ